MKRASRIVVLALVMVIVSAICVAPTINAEVEIMPFASAIIANATASTTALGSGKVKGTGVISAYSTCSKLGITSIKLQEDRDGTWVTVASASSKYGTNTTSYSYTVSHTGTVGKKYRTTVSFTATSGSTTETKTSTSGTVTAK